MIKKTWKDICLTIAVLGVVSGSIYWRKAIYPYYRVQQATVYAPLREIKVEEMGLLAETMLYEGDCFQKGQILFSLDVAVESSHLGLLDMKIFSVAQRIEELNSQAEESLEQYAYLEKQLGESEIVGELLAEAQSLQEKGAHMEQEKALLEAERISIQKTLEKLSFAAPFEGVVLRRYVEPGEKVKEGGSVLLICQKDLSIEAEIPETMLSNISLHQTAIITLPSYPGKTWRGEVSWISPSVTDGKLKIRVGAKDLPFKTGLKADVLLKIR